MNNINDKSTPSTIDNLQVGLAILSATLSIIGSTVIVIKVIRGFGFMNPYDRIVLGMSACDILKSIALAMYEVDLHPHYAGTEHRTKSFLSLLSTSLAIWYNAMSSLYFLLIFLSQTQQRGYVQKFERWAHLSGLYFPIVAIVGVIRKWYNHGMDEVSCGLSTIVLIVCLTPITLSILFIIIAYSIVYAVLQKSFRCGESETQKRLWTEARKIMILY
eukprot:3380010-Ditylum_brightwellii.AAC.1